MVYHYGWTAYSKVLQWDITLVHGQNFLFIRAISEKETNKQNINICMKNNFTRKKNTHFFLLLFETFILSLPLLTPEDGITISRKKRNDILKYLMEEKTSTFQCSIWCCVWHQQFLLFWYIPPTNIFWQIEWSLEHILYPADQGEVGRFHNSHTTIHLPLRLVHAQRQQCNIQWAKNGKNSAIKKIIKYFNDYLPTYNEYYILLEIRGLCSKHLFLKTFWFLPYKP